LAYRIAVCEDDETMLKSICGDITTVFEQLDISVEIKQFTHSSELMDNSDIATLDAVFLDIDMPEFSGIEVAQSLRDISKRLCIVFVTNMDDLVYQSIKCQPFRFVRKSHLDTELSECVSALVHKIASDELCVELPGARGMICAKVDDIMCFTSVRHHVYAVTTKENIEIVATMKKLEERLSPNGFIRVHSSYLVNYRFIFSIDREGVVMDNGHTIPISRYRIADVKHKLHYFIRKW